MSVTPKTLIEVKAKLLCEGFRADAQTAVLLQKQNPWKVKRGGLSSGGELFLGGRVPVNAPYYEAHETDLVLQWAGGELVIVFDKNIAVCDARIMRAPEWYARKVNGMDITRILTAHNRQLAGGSI